MAVVQISKIQLRRGKKNQGTGMPQLASGEMAWAVDTQEVFIGNGAVSEGAPYVGNTKILTEHDSLLELANIYQYKKESVIPVTGTVTRSLQDRLDDGIVNVKNWGIITYPYPATSEETIATQTTKMQEAIREISSKVKVTLEFNPGEYRFLETLTLPSHIKISGAGKNITTFKFTGTGNAFETADEELVSGIVLDNFSVKLENTNSTGILINNSEGFRFSNLRVEYNIGATLVDDVKGLKIIGLGSEKNNKFKGLEFSGLSYAVYTDGNASNNNFDDCLVEYVYDAFSFGNLSPTAANTGANYNTVTNSTFDKIGHYAIVVYTGYGNLSRGNIFKHIGNFNIINFVTEGNSSEQDIFERSRDLENNESFSAPYVQEVGGIVYRQKSNPKQIILQSTSGNTAVAFRLPISNAIGYEINYIYKSTNFNQTRKGTLYVTFDSVTDRLELVDEYEYAGLLPSGETAIKFTVGTGEGSGIKHLVIEYINNNGTTEDSDINTFTYTYSVLS